MPEMSIGNSPAGGSGGIGGIPTNVLLIGAGVLGVGVLLMMNKGKSSSGGLVGNPQDTGAVSAQLSSVQQLQKEQYGELTKLFANQQEQLGSAVGGLSTILDHQAAVIGNVGSSLNIWGQQTQNQITAFTNAFAPQMLAANNQSAIAAARILAQQGYSNDDISRIMASQP